MKPSMLKWVRKGILAVIGGIIGVIFLPLIDEYLPPDLMSDASVRTACYALFALLGIIFIYSIIWIFSGLIKKLYYVKKALLMKPLQEITIASLGLIIGLIIANLISIPILKIPVFGVIIALFLNGLLGYTGIHIALKKKEEFNKNSFILKKNSMLSNPQYLRPKILDTSVIIDGRIADICKTGFIEGLLVIPTFVLRELQHIADSSDGLKRNRGRRGLDILNIIQKEPDISVKILDQDFEGISEVDIKLIKLAELINGIIITNDYNLNKIASFSGVSVLNINELANAVKPVVLPGEDMLVQILKDGKENGQGIAYLDDGTMVVVDGGKKHIGESVDVTVTSILQTPAGRMIFAKLKCEEEKAG